MNTSAISFFVNNKVGKIFFLVYMGIMILIFSAFIAAKVYIKREAKNVAKEASAVFQKDNTESLLILLDSENYSLKEKNMAVWGLGVLKDKNALSKLELLYTDEECNHSEELCQYELKKAILKIKGEFRGSWQAWR